MSTPTQDAEQHASVKTYLIVAAILTVITIVEVATYYEPLKHIARPLLVSLLIILSAAKFFIVVGFYMHLKYDARIFRRFFLFPLAIAASILFALVALFWYHPMNLVQ